MQPALTFLHITDTHIGPTRDYSYYGLSPLEHLERLVSLINDFPQQPDFIVHTGDIVQDRSTAAYELAVEALARLKAPVYYLAGNHDDAALVRKYLFNPPDQRDPNGPLDYCFEVQGERFVVLDAHNSRVADPLGWVNEDQLDWLREETESDGPPLTILLHYVPFPMASPWLDERMIIVNGADLHAALLPARDRLRGVFFGHLHRHCHIVRDGIIYTCAGSPVIQYGWRPWDTTPLADPDAQPSYSVVQYFADHVIVQRYTFPRP